MAGSDMYNLLNTWWPGKQRSGFWNLFGLVGSGFYSRFIIPIPDPWLDPSLITIFTVHKIFSLETKFVVNCIGTGTYIILTKVYRSFKSFVTNTGYQNPLSVSVKPFLDFIWYRTCTQGQDLCIICIYTVIGYARYWLEGKEYRTYFSYELGYL